MRILVLSQTGYGLGIMSYLTSEGHSVQSMVSSSLELPRIERAVNASIPDIAIVDSEAFSPHAEWVRSRGVKVLGASKWSSLLESNPGYQASLVDAIGYKPAPKEGTEAIVCIWFNGHKIISQYLVLNYEHMMAGNVGAKVGSAGYVAYFDVERSRLVSEIVTPLEKYLRKAGHKGCFSIATRIGENGEYGVYDISASYAKPYTNALYENTRKHRSDVLLDVFNESSAAIEALNTYVCGVLVSVYPYPRDIPDNPLEVFGINQDNIRHMWSMDLESSGDTWRCGLLNGCVGYAAARGVSIDEAQRRAYRTISNLKIDGIQYRNDIGKCARDDMFKLRKHNLV